MLIDTGFNREECRTALFSGLKSLGVSLDNTDVFITHMHVDHCGLISAVATEKNAIYCGEVDAKQINWALTPEYWPDNLAFAVAHGFPARQYSGELQHHPVQIYGPDHPHDFSLIREGDVLEAGEYSFVAVETPGHTPGHMCLYEPDKKILVSGDHILNEITPNITMFYEGLPDPLGHYLKSLDKVDRLDIDLVLPGHLGVIENAQERIAELKQHYDNRLQEVLSVMADDSMSAYKVASRISWDLPLAWDQFPLQHLWFATGETISHLEHLRLQNKVRMLEHKETLLFELMK